MTSSEFRAWRLGLGLSQTAAATALGVSLRTIRSLESGRKIRTQVELACRFLADNPHTLPPSNAPRRQILPRTVSIGARK